MKIILAAKSVYPFHPVGGVQKYVYYFAKALKKKGLDVEIVAPLDKGNPRLENFESIQYTFLPPAIYWYLEYPIGWFGVHLFNQKLAGYLQKINFDILHSFDMVSYQYLQLSKRKLVVSQIFTDNYLTNPISIINPLNILSLIGRRTQNIKKEKVKISTRENNSLILKYPVQYFFKIKPMETIFKKSEAVLFEEEVYLKEVSNLFELDLKRSHVLPVGTDVGSVDSFLNTQIKRETLGLKDNDLVLITVNRLAADKGVDKIILALPEILQQIPQAKLIIVGKGYLEGELKQLIDANGLQTHIRHFQEVPEKDLYRYYALSDIYICAFSYPGSSVSTLEAMACGLPVITTAQPWLVDQERNGLVLANNDPATISAAVIKLFKLNQLKTQGRISREIVQAYDWDNIAKRACGIYEKLLTS